MSLVLFYNCVFVPTITLKHDVRSTNIETQFVFIQELFFYFIYARFIFVLIIIKIYVCETPRLSQLAKSHLYRQTSVDITVTDMSVCIMYNLISTSHPFHHFVPF